MSPAPTSAPEPDPTGLRVLHAWIDVVDLLSGTTTAGVIDTPRRELERFVIYRTRFAIVNDSSTRIDLVPVLEVATGTAPRGYVRVAPGAAVVGAPFYVAPDQGRTFRVRTSPIPASSLRWGPTDVDATAVAGASLAGVNPGPTLALPPGAYTEVEFAIRATVDAEWDQAYQFRITDSGAAIPGSRQALVTMRSRPPVVLTPGQQRGVRVGDELPLYPLRLPTAAPIASSPHLTDSLTADTCAGCHLTHAADAELLLVETATQAGLCLRCHDGSAAASNVLAEYADPALPANDPATSSWYSHPALDAAAPPSRGSGCTDCHQPHLASGELAVATPDGWTASGAIEAAAGVTVTNGPAGSEPAYTATRAVGFEYELCFRCHSGFAQLPANDPDHPSRWALDKGRELNPANASYHPVERPGTNQTATMRESLAGTSPYKRWTFDPGSTVRCVNCHGGPGEPAGPGSSGADARLPVHALANRGLLTATYRDRQLKAAGDGYQASDFALCFLCHAEAPFVDTSGDPRADTAFPLHGVHVSLPTFVGTGGVDIDVAGAGQGLAICAECHFRIHSTALSYNLADRQNTRLVNFAPNVETYGDRLGWDPASGGSCTVLCHGRPHVREGY